MQSLKYTCNAEGSNLVMLGDTRERKSFDCERCSMKLAPCICEQCKLYLSCIFVHHWCQFTINKTRRTSMMGKREDLFSKAKNFCSTSSFHPFPHLIINGQLRRWIWVLLAIICNSIFIYSVYLLLDEFWQSPTKSSSSRGESSSQNVVQITLVPIRWALYLNLYSIEMSSW